MFRALQWPSSGARQTAVAASGFRMNVEVEVFSAMVDTNRPRLRTLQPPHSYGNQRLQQQLDGLLMMGIVMPETCWAVSVRQGNGFYDWLLHLVGCFIRVCVCVCVFFFEGAWGTDPPMICLSLQNTAFGIFFFFVTEICPLFYRIFLYTAELTQDNFYNTSSIIFPMTHHKPITNELSFLQWEGLGSEFSADV
jgi:hypothetical protein